MKSAKISNENDKELKQIKLNEDLRSLDEVIKKLLDLFKAKKVEEPEEVEEIKEVNSKFIAIM